MASLTRWFSKTYFLAFFSRKRNSSGQPRQQLQEKETSSRIRRAIRRSPLFDVFEICRLIIFRPALVVSAATEGKKLSRVSDTRALSYLLPIFMISIAIGPRSPSHVTALDVLAQMPDQDFYLAAMALGVDAENINYTNSLKYMARPGADPASHQIKDTVGSADPEKVGLYLAGLDKELSGSYFDTLRFARGQKRLELMGYQALIPLILIYMSGAVYFFLSFSRRVPLSRFMLFIRYFGVYNFAVTTAVYLVTHPFDYTANSALSRGLGVLEIILALIMFHQFVALGKTIQNIPYIRAMAAAIGSGFLGFAVAFGLLFLVDYATRLPQIQSYVRALG